MYVLLKLRLRSNFTVYNVFYNHIKLYSVFNNVLIIYLNIEIIIEQNIYVMNVQTLTNNGRI